MGSFLYAGRGGDRALDGIAGMSVAIDPSRDDWDEVICAVSLILSAREELLVLALA